MGTNVKAIPQVFYSGSGLAAARPAAATLRNGSLWYSTDTQDIDQVVAGAWVTIFDYSAIGAAHAASHQNGGADEISIAALSGLLADDQHVLDAEVLAVATALFHATRHENGGADEIDVTDLSGVLADAQTPSAHSHSAIGSYTGDNSVNRAIAHGLGVTPKLVIIRADDATAVNAWAFAIIQGLAKISAIGSDGEEIVAVTAMSATNFYIGNNLGYPETANATGIVYYWAAIG